MHNALYSSRLRKNFFNLKDVRQKGYDIKTINDNNVKYLCITFKVSNRRCMLEKLLISASRLHYIIINAIGSYTIMNKSSMI